MCSQIIMKVSQQVEYGICLGASGHALRKASRTRSLGNKGAPHSVICYILLKIPPSPEPHSCTRSLAVAPLQRRCLWCGVWQFCCPSLIPRPPFDGLGDSGRESCTPTSLKANKQRKLVQRPGFDMGEGDQTNVPVMRRIAISTPNVMAALRRISRDQ